MTAAKVIGVIERPHTADAVSACTQVRVSRHLDTSTTTQNGPKHGPTSNQWVLLNEICMASPLPHCWHNSKKFYWTWMEEKYQTENAYFVRREQGLFLSVYVDDVFDLERSKTLILCGRNG